MKLAPLRRRSDALPGVSGVARLDRRTNRLVGRLNPGDIAVIDHVDLDRVAAEALVAAKVAAVINAQPSVSGRYPNLGPDLIVAQRHRAARQRRRRDLRRGQGGHQDPHRRRHRLRRRDAGGHRHAAGRRHRSPR